MPKLYTKTGDKGLTSLYDMRRVKKSDILFDLTGGVDELNSHIGMLCAFTTELHPELTTSLRTIQRDLLNLGSDIATTKPEVRSKMVFIDQKDVERLEKLIDKYDDQNEPLTSFILPGVKCMDAQAQICRTVCRRFERDLWTAIHSVEDNGSSHLLLNENNVVYVNRLSDLFFALARWLSGCKEIVR